MSNLGGKRPGAGRKPGGKNLRTVAATELVREAQERFPDYNPLAALIALAMDAEANGDLETARQCHASVLPYTAPKYRPIEADPDAIVALEGRIAAARLQAQADVVEARPGLADRLMRVMERLDAETPPMVVRPVTVINAAPHREERAPEAPEPAQAIEPPAGPSAPVAEPKPLSAAEAAIIGAPQSYEPFLPERPAFADTDYSPLSGWD